MPLSNDNICLASLCFQQLDIKSITFSVRLPFVAFFLLYPLFNLLRFSVKIIECRNGYFNVMDKDQMLKDGIFSNMGKGNENFCVVEDGSVGSAQNDNFPRTDQLGYLQYLMKYLKEGAEAKGVSINDLKGSILELHRELELVVSNFLKIPKRCRLMPDFTSILTSITNLAYQAEYALDSVLAGENSIDSGALALKQLIWKLYRESKLVHMASGRDASFVSDFHFGLPKELLVIPLVVTDNARQVVLSIISSNFSQIVFNLCPWCTIPKDFNETKSVLLSGLTGLPDCLRGLNECLGLLRVLLSKRRYLLVLWDVRDNQVLLEILAALPNDKNGSRVVVVTPAPELALQIRRYPYRYLLVEMLGVQFSSPESAETANVKPSVNGDIVGFKNVEVHMLDQILGEERHPQLQIISIFGMAGQGKTSLANKLYNHASITDHFDVRAWCHVSQVYQKRELLLELLSRPTLVAKNSKAAIDKSSTYYSDDLADRLYKSLKRRRFLIVMDDIWDVTTWKDLRAYIPDDKNGSRIIFTTRIRELAKQAMSDSMLVPLRSLSDDECWELLEKRVFLDKKCPTELEVVGRNIARSCRGLPLSVVLASGLLLRMDKKTEVWEKVAESLSSRILEHPEAQCPHILELSYKHLPDCLKPCFLYLGAFLEDRSIPVTKVTRIWIAEGFVNSARLESLVDNSQLEISETQSLEDVAEGYLVELVHRSLVLTANEKSTRRIKACRIHDLLRNFCIMKAKEENFLLQTSKYDEEFSNFEEPSVLAGQQIGYSGFQDVFSYRINPKPVRYDIRRICIYSEGNHQFRKSKPSISGVRSLLLFATSDIGPSHPSNVALQFSYFKLLKILDLGDINVGSTLCQIDIPLLLRYLSFQTDVNVIPPSISNLWNLETLVVKGIGDVAVEVPDFIWNMEKLRHLDISSCYFDLKPDRHQRGCLQENLQTLSTPSLAYDDDFHIIMGRLGNIRKLDCTFLDSWDDARNCNRFPVLESFAQLETLKVFYGGKRKYPCEFSFPINLKKLTLSNFCMPWSHFSQVAKLVNLEVLKLLSRTFEGEIWEMEDEEFPKLRFLKLDTLDLVTWSASENPFPCLEHLVIHGCEQLEEIPVEVLGDIPTLKEIEVVWCNPAVANSARNIQQEQLNCCNEDLKVHIYPRHEMSSLCSYNENGDTLGNYKY